MAELPALFISSLPRLVTELEDRVAAAPSPASAYPECECARFARLTVMHHAQVSS